MERRPDVVRWLYSPILGRYFEASGWLVWIMRRFKKGFSVNWSRFDVHRLRLGGCGERSLSISQVILRTVNQHYHECCALSPLFAVVTLPFR